MDELKKTEITLLEIDFEDNICCQMLVRYERCPREAAVRIYSACACGNDNRLFACAEHVTILQEGSASCGACGGPRGITSFC